MRSSIDLPRKFPRVGARALAALSIATLAAGISGNFARAAGEPKPAIRWPWATSTLWPLVAPRVPRGPGRPEPSFDMTTQQVRVRGSGSRRVLEYLDPHAPGSQPAWVAFGELGWLRKGTRFHHWGPTSDVQQWATQGIPPEAIEHAVTTQDDNDAVGGGFYVSLSPVDSAGYGPSQIVAEPDHGVLVMNINRGFGRGVAPPAETSDAEDKPVPITEYNYDHKNQGFIDGDRHVLIPVDALAKAGVEALRYSPTWLVTIRGSLLDKLSEFSWHDYVHDPRSRDAVVGELATLLEKYPPSEADLADGAFGRRFPWAARILGGQSPTEAQARKLADAMFDQTFGHAGNASLAAGGTFASAPFSQAAVEAARPYILPRMREAMHAAQARPDEDLSSFFYSMHRFGVSAHEVEPEIAELWNPDFERRPALPPPALAQLQANYKLKIVPVADGIWSLRAGAINQLQEALAWTDLYSLVEQIGRGNPTPWYVRGRTPLVLRDAKNFRAASNLTYGKLLELATIWSAGARYRDRPAFSNGPYRLDGPNRPGYFVVTAAQKAELETYPLVVSRFVPVTDAAPGAAPTWYAQYEFPSARTFRRFAPLLRGTPLLAQLRAAHAAGELADPSSAASRRLTQAIVRTFAEGAPRYGMDRIHLLSRLRIFANEELNYNVLRATAVQNGLLLADWNQLSGATFLELTEAEALSNSVLQRLSLSLTSNPYRALDLGKTVGIWEILANDPSPHADPKRFVGTMRAAFLAPKTRAMLKQGDLAGVRNVLEAAAASDRALSAEPGNVDVATAAEKPAADTPDRYPLDCLRDAFGSVSLAPAAR